MFQQMASNQHDPSMKQQHLNEIYSIHSILFKDLVFSFSTAFQKLHEIFRSIPKNSTIRIKTYHKARLLMYRVAFLHACTFCNSCVWTWRIFLKNWVQVDCLGQIRDSNRKKILTKHINSHHPGNNTQD